MNLSEVPVIQGFGPGHHAFATRTAIGDFVIDALRQQLTRRDDGTSVPIAARHFDALLFFVRHAGELLDKETLLAALWPGLVVEENSLSQAVSALRRVLGDDAQAPRYLQTVPRRGFRFIAPVVALDDAGPLGVSVAAPIAAPSALALALADVGPSASAGVSDEAVAPETDPVPPPSQRRRLLVGGAVAASALAVAGGVTWRARRSAARPIGSGLQTLAVLPFRPLVATPRDELLEVGMADSLATRLSNVPGIVVRSVGSVRRFAGPDQDPLQAARLLDVQWIVDGSIQRSGDQIRLTARLLDTALGEAAWSGTFDERFTSVFDVQDAITARVATVLAPRLDPVWQAQHARAGGTRSVDAYQFYLAARQHAQSLRRDALTRSVALYDKAITIDPSYALAWAGRSESRRRTVFGADGEPSVLLVAAGNDARRAIEIDPALAEGHAVLGWKRFCFDRDWNGAEAVFRRAIDLNPSEANAHFGYGTLLGTTDRQAESLDHLRAARTLDPLSPIQLTVEAAAVHANGAPEEGRRRLERVFDIDPQFWLAHQTLAGWLAADGDAAGSIAAYERADRLADGSSLPAAALGYLLARSGRARQARDLLARLRLQARDRYVPPTSYGLICAGLGDQAAALDALEQASTVHDVRLALVRRDVRWTSVVGNEPRYQAVVRRLGFGRESIGGGWPMRADPSPKA